MRLTGTHINTDAGMRLLAFTGRGNRLTLIYVRRFYKHTHPAGFDNGTFQYARRLVTATRPEVLASFGLAVILLNCQVYIYVTVVLRQPEL